MMEYVKDTLKQFIESRLQEATRAQALYPERFYVASSLVKKLDPEQVNCSSKVCSCFNKSGVPFTEKDFKW